MKPIAIFDAFIISVAVFDYMVFSAIDKTQEIKEFQFINKRK